MPDPTQGPSPTTGSARGNLSGLSSDDAPMVRINDLMGQWSTLVAVTTDPAASVIAKQAAQAQIAKLEPALSSAYRDAAAQERANAKVVQASGTSTAAQMIQAAAATSRADALETRANAYAEGTGAKRAQLEADARLKDSQAKIDGLKADLATETQPDQIAKVHNDLQVAYQQLEAAKQDNVAKGFSNDILKAKADVAPRVEAAAVSTAESGATVAQANAANAVQTSAANLQKTQADANKATLDLQNAQAQFDATTPEMRSQAMQADLDQKKALAAQTQQALKLAQDTHDTVVAQGQATLEATQAGTAKGLLGPLYGAQQKAAELTAMLKAGTITDPAQAHQMLQDYITSAMAGTTPYEQQKTALDTETARMGQASSLAGQQGSNYTSGFGSAMNTFSKLNDTTPVGSDSAGRGFLASMDMLRQGIGSFTPQGPAAASPLLRSMSTAGGVPTPAPSAAAPTTTIAPDGTVSITHTSAATGAPLLPAGATGTAADPTVQGSPAFLANMGPATPAHVDALWQNDPNLNPSMTQR